jgi:prevent-host-death family protein
MKILSTTDTRDQFSDVLGGVYYRNEPVAIEKQGKRIAVIISPDQYEQYEAQHQQVMAQLGQAMTAVQTRNRAIPAPQVAATVNQAIDEVRRERRAVTE